MASRRTKIISLLVAVVLTFVLFLFLSNRESDDEDNDMENITVMVAMENIPAYTEITEEMITEKDIAVDPEMVGFFTSREESLKKIANSQIYTDEILTQNRLSDREDSSLGLASTIEEGKRAITVAVDIQQGISDTIRVGNFVDLIYIGLIDDEFSATEYFETLSGSEKPANTQTLHPSLGNHFSAIALQNIKVLSLDSVFYKVENEKEIAYQSVTLEVTPEEATQIALLPSEGGIRLSLRSMEDNSIYTYPRDWIIKDTIEEVETEEEEEPEEDSAEEAADAEDE